MSTPDRKNTANVAGDELARFEAQAGKWWDPHGPYRALHAMNPARLGYIASILDPAGRDVLDVGCGGGLLAEALAGRGARVVGIDAGSVAIDAARTHLATSGLAVDYRVTTAEQLAETETARFDLVTCMELLEHVPRPDILVGACASMLRPHGYLVVSTINRTLPAYLGAVLGAEYLLRLLPRGTHNYAQFIRPAELERWLRAAGLELVDIAGLRYLPWINRCAVTRDPSINYIAYARVRD